MIRKTWWAGLALAMFVGCGETTTVDTPPTSTVPGPGLDPASATPAPGAGPAAATPAEPAAPAPGAEPAATAPAPAPEAASVAPAKGKVDLAAITLSAEELTEIKKLSEADQKLALAQKVCAVGEEDGKPNHLGSMGMPIKVTANGKTAFLCCGGCKADFEKDPAAAFAKIGK